MKRATGVNQRFGCAKHGGEAAFHILRAAAIEAAVMDGRAKRIGHTRHANGVHVAVEQKHAAVRVLPRETAEDIHSAGSQLRCRHFQAQLRHLMRDISGNLRFARASGGRFPRPGQIGVG